MCASSPARPETPRDLREIAQRLRNHFRGVFPCGYLRGKTRIRDALMRLYEISAVEAELLVDQMQARGFARYCGEPGALDHGAEPWTVEVDPLAAP